uniref:Uncharacterized protein n=1 Tax=Timema bartmani TaxID=61472 RepID=A0A7R9EPC8_9NEOP|nr:unnamed protein product [Timema bartmani]
MMEKLSLKLNQLLTTGRNVNEDVAMCCEVTNADIGAEVLNNNIQAKDGASGDEEDNSSLVQERPIPSAAEAMDHIQVQTREWQSAPNIVKPNSPTPSPLVIKWHAVRRAAVSAMHCETKRPLPLTNCHHPARAS